MRIKKSSVKETMSIAKRLKDIRINNRLTQKDMAKIVGLTSGAIGAMENGLYTPNFDVIRSLKKRLNVSYDYLIDGENIELNLSKMQTDNIALKEEVDRLRKMIDKLLK